MRVPQEVARRAVNMWAASLVLTLVGVAITIGVWLVTVSLGAPALSSIAVGLGVALWVGAAIGGVLRWLTT